LTFFIKVIATTRIDFRSNRQGSPKSLGVIHFCRLLKAVGESTPEPPLKYYQIMLARLVTLLAFMAEK